MAKVKRSEDLSNSVAAAAGDALVLEKTPAPAFDDFDDILGEIASPAPAKAADPFDDILGEIARPTPAKPADDLDDILGEIAPSVTAKPVDDLDDILGEIASPAPAPAGDPFDDILGEIAAPAPTRPVDDLDDILGEIASPAPAAAADPFDDILGEIAQPAPAPAPPVDDFDDILGEIASPAPSQVADALDDILGEVAPTVPVEPAKQRSRKRSAAPQPQAEQAIDDRGEAGMMAAPEPGPSEVASIALQASAQKKPHGGKLKRVLGALRPNLGGTREVSRKGYAAMQALVVVLGLAAAAEGAVILSRPAHAPAAAGHVQPRVVKVTVIPVDYSKVDLERYVGKVRSLPEGGRDMLRHPKVREAVVGLEGGEQLYKDLRAIAAHSPAADRMTIRDDRVTIASCDGAACGDRSFRLVYDIPHEQAAVCTNERYPDGSLNAYGYSASGNSVLSHC